jgi:hypothetical protein
MRFKIFVFLLLLLSCKNESKETIIFKKYLETTHHLEIPENSNIYIVFPKLACKGCVQDLIGNIADNLDKNKTYTFIVSNTSIYFPANLSSIGKWHFDKKGDIDKINLGLSNLTIIKTNKGQVVSVIPIDIGEYDKLTKALE